MKRLHILSVGIGLSVIFTVVVFLGFSDNDEMVLEQDKVIQYIPSNITKANPNILAGYGSASMSTTNITDVKSRILYTIQGTVLNVGIPIDYIMPLPTSIFEDDEKYYEPHGAIPVTIFVDEVHKGELNVNEFTFYINSIKNPDGKYYLTPSQPQFELNEKVIVHISRNDDFAEFVGVDDFYYVALLEYGKYKIQNNIVFSQSYSLGKPLLQVQQEALE